MLQKNPDKVEFFKKMLLLALKASIVAGRKIMEVYRTELDINYKADNSPITIADENAHKSIEESLKHSGLPILSEEGKDIPYSVRSSWEMFWLVDPIDGTKEFISRNGEFTVNIALICNGQPELGVVFAPALDLVYFGLMFHGAYKMEEAFSFFTDEILDELNGDSWELVSKSASRLPTMPEGPDGYTIVGSRSHGGRDLEDYLDLMRRCHGEVKFRPAGSSIKICLVAEGTAHQYPRLGPTMEWDTAAGHAIAAAAGAGLYEYQSDKSLVYNKKDLHNPWFIVERRQKEI